MSEYKGIPAKEATKKRLDGFGRKGEPYDALLNRLMNELESWRSGKSPEGREAEASSAPAPTPLSNRRSST